MLELLTRAQSKPLEKITSFVHKTIFKIAGLRKKACCFSTFSDYYLENAEQNAWLTIKEEIISKGRGTFVPHSRKNRRKKAIA